MIDPRRAFDDLVRDPIRHSLRQGVKRIGRELHRLGGLDAMSRPASLTVSGGIVGDDRGQELVEGGFGRSHIGAGFAQAAFDDLVRDPIRHSLRQGVKRIGRELHRLGGRLSSTTGRSHHRSRPMRCP
jgi:hypothetical protein